jgi:hypothetical protein
MPTCSHTGGNGALLGFHGLGLLQPQPLLSLLRRSLLSFLRLGWTNMSVRLVCDAVILFCIAHLLTSFPALRPKPARIGYSDGRCF